MGMLFFTNAGFLSFKNQHTICLNKQYYTIFQINKNYHKKIHLFDQPFNFLHEQKQYLAKMRMSYWSCINIFLPPVLTHTRPVRISTNNGLQSTI